MAVVTAEEEDHGHVKTRDLAAHIEGEQPVRTLTDHAGVSQPAVSKHLGVLKLAGLVRDLCGGK